MTPQTDTAIGINPSPYLTYPMHPMTMTQYPPTQSEGPWNYQELATGWYTLIHPDLTLLPCYNLGETQSLSLPPLDIETLNLQDLGWPRIVTPVPLTVSPEESGMMTPWAFPSMTPLTLWASTTSGLNSQRSTDESLDPTEPRHGNFDNGTSRPNFLRTNNLTGSTWTFSSWSNEETPSSEDTSMLRSLLESTPMQTDLYSHLCLDFGYPVYVPEPRRSNMISGTTSMCSTSWSRPDSSWRRQMDFEGFKYNLETFGEGFVPSEVAEDYPGFYQGYPGPLPNSQPNP